MDPESVEERMVSHLLLNFGILNYESTLRIRNIIEQKTNEERRRHQPNCDPHVIFERSLGEFFRTMTAQEVQQLSQFHENRINNKTAMTAQSKARPSKKEAGAGPSNEVATPTKAVGSAEE